MQDHSLQSGWSSYHFAYITHNNHYFRVQSAASCETVILSAQNVLYLHIHCDRLCGAMSSQVLQYRPCGTFPTLAISPPKNCTRNNLEIPRWGYIPYLYALCVLMPVTPIQITSVVQPPQIRWLCPCIQWSLLKCSVNSVRTDISVTCWLIYY